MVLFWGVTSRCDPRNTCNKRQVLLTSIYQPSATKYPELAEEALHEARHTLSAAMTYALAIRAPESDALLEAFNRQVDLTARMARAGLIPVSPRRGRSGGGSIATAMAWLENNIEQLLADPTPHPDVQAWAALNDERHRIRHRLPRLN